MISWRYHVVSIVAVILAFGLGILAGTSVVNDEFVRNLQENTNDAQQQRDAALAEVAFYERFAREMQPTLRDDVLTGETAVVVTMEGVDGPARRAVEELTAAGVEVTATLQVTGRLAEPEAAEDAAILQEVLGTASTEPETLRERAVDELAARLAGGPDPEGDDVLERLLGEGLITADRDLETDGLLELGGDGQLMVLAAGGPAPQGSPSPQAFLVPLTERLVGLDVAAAAVGPREDPYGFVSAIRDASDVPDCALVTVDDIDLTVGGLALVMGLERFLDDPDPAVLPGGDYGVDGHAIVPGADEAPGSCRR